MIPYIEQTLYTDPQAQIPVCFCECCGGECYHPCRLCPDCGETP